ncbi:uncharacterized protein STEHIDRAFT_168169 [Stereum hirsutum FP-91666 SS1]|uniref:uncharacterized protein n=1 Tax=Stereum hirsutum (strain FP-91666) TaxID=721885 RepID=UPI000440B835|nr:uncharacterized protein STEHIDRAFT_168169 [Stereum hirsutum FP-91666 SS1]EIM87422.1 hypothetical protein STEHIDRAFT_168169 [Stereum hirsutum FP-91666 SS1]
MSRYPQPNYQLVEPTQNFIPRNSIPHDICSFHDNTLFPCKSSTMTAINQDIERDFIRAGYWADLEPTDHSIGEFVLVRKPFRDTTTKGPLWGPWVRAQVMGRGAQTSILGLSVAWYHVRLGGPTTSGESLVVFPGLEEIKKSSSTREPQRPTADEALQAINELTTVLVPEYVLNPTRNVWYWEWTPATIISYPDDPVIRVFFQGSSQAAKRHWHHVPDGPLNSVVNGHTLPRTLHRDWAYLDEVRSTRYRTPEFESYPVHPGTFPIHAIWVAPMTRGTCIILERHKQALARQVPRF